VAPVVRGNIVENFLHSTWPSNMPTFPPRGILPLKCGLVCRLEYAPWMAVKFPSAVAMGMTDMVASASKTRVEGFGVDKVGPNCTTDGISVKFTLVGTSAVPTLGNVVAYPTIPYAGVQL